MKKAFLRIIQISDMHLFASAEQALLGVKTQTSFQAVVDLLNTKKNNVDLILLSGDLAQDGSYDAYKRIAEVLKTFNIPIYCIPGNHDNVDVMRKVYPYGTILTDTQIFFDHWQIILLNSQKTNAIEGCFDRSQLIYLQECLKAYPQHRAVVVFHHQPIPVGSKWLDNHGLKNSQEFWQIVSQYPNINTILFGHVHQEFEKNVNGIKCYSAPSTCFQFKRNQDHFGLENLPPGYRWIDLYQDGHVETGIERTEKYIGYFDKDAKGY